MVKKILKWTLRVILVIIGLLLLISVLVYIPPVQDFIIRKAGQIVESSTGMRLDIERFRLRFPLIVTVDNTTVATAEGDALASVGRLDLRVSVWPLLRGEVGIGGFSIKEAAVNYADTASNMTLRGTLGELDLRGGRIGLKGQTAEVRRITLSDADIDLSLGESAVEDTTASAEIPWRIDVGDLDLNNILFALHMRPDTAEVTVDIIEGNLSEIAVNLKDQQVGVSSVTLDRGRYAYLTGSSTAQTEEAAQPDTLLIVNDSIAVTTSEPWTIRVGNVKLTDNIMSYGLLYGNPKPGLDPEHIFLENINISIDSVYNRSSDVSANIRQLALRERSGLEVTDGHGIFAMDSSRISLSGFMLRTTASEITADVSAGAALLGMDTSAPFTASLDARLGSADIFTILPQLDESLRIALRGKDITASGDFTGTLADVNINRLSAALPGHIDFNATGNVTSVTDIDNLGANLAFDGTFRDLDFVKGILPDTALQRRIGFPNVMTLGGTLSMTGNTYTPDIVLTADSGRLELKGRIDTAAESYTADIAIDQFPLYRFLPADSLGMVTLSLNADGQGFNPVADGAMTDVRLNVDRLDYNNYNYSDLYLAARLDDHDVKAKLTSASEALMLDLDIAGDVRENAYQARVNGSITRADAQRMHFSETPLALSADLSIQAAAYPDTTYMADATIENFVFTSTELTQRVPHTAITASADRTAVQAKVNSGDLSLDFLSPVGLDSLMNSITLAAAEAQRQLAERNIDIVALQQAAPPLTLEAKAGRNNALHQIAAGQGIDFSGLTVSARTGDAPLRAEVIVLGVNTAGITLDTLSAQVGRTDDDRLAYYLRMANRPGNLDELGLIYIYGMASADSTTVNIRQNNRNGEAGFRFGLNAKLLDEAVRVSMTDMSPIFAYEHWTVNEGNYLEYRFNQEMYADLDMRNNDQRVRIYSVDYANMPAGSIRLDMANIDIAKTLDLLPNPPAVAGKLNTNIAVGLSGDLIDANGSLGVLDLSYDGERVGDVGVIVISSSDSTGVWNLDGGVTIDEYSGISARGTYDTRSTDGAMDFLINIPGFPLAAANAFIPDDAARLSGTLEGSLTLKGTPSAMDINGELGFAGANVLVSMIGTTFGLSTDKIVLSNNTVDFNEFGLIAPNNEKLSIDGSVNFRDFNNITADLALNATNFEAINSMRSGGSQVYGRMPIDVDVTARGALESLSIRGDIALLSNTNVTYVMRDSPLEITDQEQHIVTFVSFADTTALADLAGRTPAPASFAIDMLVNVDINDNVRATVNLSESGSDRIELAGGGDLSMTMNTQGDTRLTGRYVVTSGRVVYNPPIISQKDFAVDDGSYVEWTGELANPSFNITATETTRGTATMADGTTSTETFDLIIMVTNNLENMAINFDLEAPDNSTIQNQLASVTPEQRSTQAMNMLLFSSYSETGALNFASILPGGGGGTEAMIANFVEQQFNQWARNNLSGVDLSIGIDQSDPLSSSSHTDYSYSVSKSLFNERMKVTVGGSISDDPTADVSDNIVNDVAIEYRLTQRDNMFLKVYRYNTRPSILEGEVVETGVGFLVRRKMNRLGELFRITRNPERKKARQLRRELRQQVQQEQEAAGVDTASPQRQDNPLQDAFEEADNTDGL